jgi:hypothetical protein
MTHQSSLKLTLASLILHSNNPISLPIVKEQVFFADAALRSWLSSVTQYIQLRPEGITDEHVTTVLVQLNIMYWCVLMMLKICFVYPKTNTRKQLSQRIGPIIVGLYRVHWARDRPIESKLGLKAFHSGRTSPCHDCPCCRGWHGHRNRVIKESVSPVLQLRIIFVRDNRSTSSLLRRIPGTRLSQYRKHCRTPLGRGWQCADAVDASTQSLNRRVGMITILIDTSMFAMISRTMTTCMLATVMTTPMREVMCMSVTVTTVTTT